MDTFPKMTEIVPPGESGDAKIEHFTLSGTQSLLSATKPGMYCPPGGYAQLFVNGQLVMSDTRHEHISNIDAVIRSRGHVFIAGLGLGMICHPIARKPKVSKITVIEKSQGVIDLVGPTLPDKVEVIRADIFDFKPEKGTKYDTIYFDIWPNMCTDYLPEMGKLLRRFRKHLTEGGWINCWCRKTLQAQKRKERSFGW